MINSKYSEIRELTFEVERFYFDEAALIEAGDYKKWANLLADDIVYYMPQREFTDRSVNRELDFIGAHSFDGQGKGWIMDRIAWLSGGPTPEIPRPMRRMLITNVRVQQEHENGIEAQSKFMLWETHSTSHGTTFVGQRQDFLRRFEEGWHIVRREITLDSAVLPRSLTNFF